MFSSCMLTKRLSKAILSITFVISFVLIFLLVFLNFIFLQTNVDSARYMLSALIQSEAAIIAIVVTLSLVAIQMAASSYSVRVIYIFRKTPDLWILLFIYGFVIFLGLTVLRLIDSPNPQLQELILFCPIIIDYLIAITYTFGILAFVFLAVYIWDILGLLNPSTIIGILAEDISKENILESARNEKAGKDNPNDAILPIIDIIRSAQMKYDYETARDGVRAIRISTNNIFKEETFEIEEMEVISKHLLLRLRRIARLAIDKGDEYSTNEVVMFIQIIGTTVVEKKLDEVAYTTMVALKEIGVMSANQKFTWSTEVAASALANLNIHDFKIRGMASEYFKVNHLRLIGEKAIECELWPTANSIVDLLKVTGMWAVANASPKLILIVYSALKGIAMHAIVGKYDYVLDNVKKSLESVNNEICDKFQGESRNEYQDVLILFTEINDALEKAQIASKSKDNSPVNN